jgi:hypothetical protein
MESSEPSRSCSFLSIDILSAIAVRRGQARRGQVEVTAAPPDSPGTATAAPAQGQHEIGGRPVACLSSEVWRHVPWADRDRDNAACRPAGGGPGLGSGRDLLTAQYSRQGTGPQQRGPGTGSRGQRGRLSGSLCVNLCLEARLGGGWRGDD